MRNVVIWGYGWFDNILRDSVARFWTRDVNLRAVVDLDPGSTTPAFDIPIITRGEALELFSQGGLEGVLLAIPDKDREAAERKYLSEHGISIVTLGSVSDFVNSYDLPEAVPSPYELGARGYVCTAIDGAYGVYSPFVPPKTLYVFTDDGHIVGDYWYKIEWKSWRNLNYPMPLSYRAAPVEDIEGEVCVLAKLWSDNYAHFTYECLDRVHLLERAGYRGRYVVNRTGFSETLLELAGVSPDRIIWTETLRKSRIYRFGRVICVNVLPPAHKNGAPILVEFAKRVQDKLDLASLKESHPSRLFVRRIGSRKLLNCQDVIERYGFTEVVPENLSVREQIEHFYAADIVLSPHGANSTSSLYMRPGTTLVETFGRNYVYPWFFDTTYAGGINYLPVIEMPVTESSHDRWLDDYNIDERMLDMALEQAVRLSSANDDEAHDRGSRIYA